jgi:hypothetical protein
MWRLWNAFALTDSLCKERLIILTGASRKVHVLSRVVNAASLDSVPLTVVLEMTELCVEVSWAFPVALEQIKHVCGPLIPSFPII